MAPPPPGPAPRAVPFTEQSPGPPAAWSWAFGDGTSSPAQNPVHTYAAAGSYSVSLTVTNSGGSNSLTKPSYISVATPPAPLAPFSGSPTSGTAPLAVTFTDQSTGPPAAWSWDFGDGTSSTAQNPVHTYAAAGSYSVSLTVTNSGGSNSLTKPSYIGVTCTRYQGFSYSGAPNPPTSGKPHSNVRW